MELATGSSLAQVFSLLLMPVISRIYSPKDMGDYALYVAISSILGVLGNFRLDFAVILAGDEEEGSRLVWLGLGSSVMVALLALLGLCLIREPGAFAYYTAASIGCIGGIQSLVNWHSRQKSYRLLSTRSAGEKLLVLLLGIGMGYWGMTQYGLIVSQTAGLVFSLLYLLLTAGLEPPRFARRLWVETLHKFSDFPLKNFLATVLVAFSMFFPSILIAANFEKAELGYYNLASRVFDIPINLIGYTFSTVYYKHTSTSSAPYRLKLFWKSLKLLAMVFLPAFFIASVWGPSIFKIVFGVQWAQSGVLAQWMAPLTAMRLFFISQSTLLLVQRKLGLDLGISLGLFVAQISGFLIGNYYYHSILACVVAMSALGVLVYLVGLSLIHRVLVEEV